MGNPIKKKKVLISLRCRKLDIVFLQETHLPEQESQKLCKDWVGHVFYSTGSSQSRGVITLVNKNLQFKCINEKRDKEGRIIVILAELQGRPYILANTYVPNSDDPYILFFYFYFFATLEGILCDLGDYPVIWAGDMNVVVDAILDRSHSVSTRNPRSNAMLKQVCTSLGLVDAWRLLNPSGRDYTFFSSPHNTY